MPHRQFSAPSVRPAHSCYPPAALPVCPTILLSTHPRRLFICLPLPFVPHTCRSTRFPPYPSAHTSAPPIRTACSLARSSVCPPARLRRFPCLCGHPHYLLVHAIRLSAPSVPLSAYPAFPACLRGRAATTRNSRKHHATDTLPAEITDKYLFLRPEYNYL